MIPIQSRWRNQPRKDDVVSLSDKFEDPSSLVFHCNQQNGDRLFDIGNRLELSILNPDWRTSMYGDVLYSGGPSANTIVNCDSIAPILTRQNGCMWVDLINYDNSGGNHEFLTTYASPSQGKRYLWLNGSELSIGWEVATHVSTGIFPQIGERFTFSLEWDSTGGVAYYNGVDIGLSLAAPVGAGPLSVMDLFGWVGSSNVNFRPTCDLLSFKIYPRAMGPEKQRELYENPYSDLKNKVYFLPIYSSVEGFPTFGGDSFVESVFSAKATSAANMESEISIGETLSRSAKMNAAIVNQIGVADGTSKVQSASADMSSQISLDGVMSTLNGLSGVISDGVSLGSIQGTNVSALSDIIFSVISGATFDESKGNIVQLILNVNLATSFSNLITSLSSIVESASQDEVFSGVALSYSSIVESAGFGASFSTEDVAGAIGFMVAEIVFYSAISDETVIMMSPMSGEITFN